MGLSDHTPHCKSRSVCMYVCMYVYIYICIDICYGMKWAMSCDKVISMETAHDSWSTKTITDEDIR